MFKLSRKALPGLFVVLAMLLGAWTTPAITAQSVTPENHNQSGGLVGHLAQIPGVQERVKDLYAFSMDVSAISKSNTSKAGQDFIDDSVTSNTLELISMKYAVTRVRNAELRGLIQMMITQHTKDLATAEQLKKAIGSTTPVDLKNATVYEFTPDYDLGIRTENLVKEYLQPLSSTTRSTFDMKVMDILSEEHVADVQGELAAEGQIQNPELWTFAKHSADVTEFHIQLLNELHDRLAFGFESAPDYQKPYEQPTVAQFQAYKSGTGQ